MDNIRTIGCMYRWAVIVLRNRGGETGVFTCSDSYFISLFLFDSWFVVGYRERDVNIERR